MPNTRRRRFSVQHDIAILDPSKLQIGHESSSPEPDPELKDTNPYAMKSNNEKNFKKPCRTGSSAVSLLSIVTECNSSTSILTVPLVSTVNVDKDVTASSSNIDLFCLNNMGESHDSQSNGFVYTLKEIPAAKRDARQTTRRDKYPRQHRVKVRSPKRRTPIPEAYKYDQEEKLSIETTVTDWNQEVEMETENLINALEPVEEVNRISNHSLEAMCRICHGGDLLSPELGQLISACSCRGTVGRVHVKCLERWLTESGKSRCELCGTRYITRRLHKYGVPKALIMWILSQNAKQLMVDSLGIMLMSPLAVLAAWLSGRTLAGLMTQDSHVTPWPLASTFVLACMTLVCYYCWIVSAATRHALGWWIWYRSQYEVRLQLLENEE